MSLQGTVFEGFSFPGLAHLFFSQIGSLLPVRCSGRRILLLLILSSSAGLCPGLKSCNKRTVKKAEEYRLWAPHGLQCFHCLAKPGLGSSEIWHVCVGYRLKSNVIIVTHLQPKASCCGGRAVCCFSSAISPSLNTNNISFLCTPFQASCPHHPA